MHARRAVTALAVVASLLGGCAGGTPSSAGDASAAASPTLEPTATLPSPTANTVGLPDGWERVRGQGFSIGLPSSWRSVAAEDLLGTGLMEELRDANPAAGPVIDTAAAAMRAGQIQFFAFDPGRQTMRTGFATNVNVIRVGATGGRDLDSLLDEMAGSVSAQIPVNGKIRTETTTLPAGETAVLGYEWTIGLPGGKSIDVAVTQYLVVTDGDGYIVTLTGPSRFARRDRAAWEAIAFSFRFG